LGDGFQQLCFGAAPGAPPAFPLHRRLVAIARSHGIKNDVIENAVQFL
jgi:hypothetical protein